MQKNLGEERDWRTEESRGARQAPNNEVIVPFAEEPSVERENRSAEANNLFSLFTANIIKAKTIFTR